MYCDRCGTPIHVGQRFCAACGAPYVLPRVQAEGGRRKAEALTQAAREVLAPYGLTSLEEARLYLLPDQYDEVLRQTEGGRRKAEDGSGAVLLPSSNLAPVTLG